MMGYNRTKGHGIYLQALTPNLTAEEIEALPEVIGLAAYTVPGDAGVTWEEDGVETWEDGRYRWRAKSTLA